MVVTTLIEGLITLDPEDELGVFSYLLGPFWLFTILLNIMSIVAEVRGTSKYGKNYPSNPDIPSITVQSSRLSSVFPKKKPRAKHSDHDAPAANPLTL